MSDLAGFVVLFRCLKTSPDLSSFKQSISSTKQPAQI